MQKICYNLYRVSTKKQLYSSPDNKDDIPMQRQSCREFAERMDWTVAKEFEEKGVSASKVSAANRDAIQDLKEPYTPVPGDRYEIQGRFFVVDTVNIDRENVSLRDVTFESNTGFPIFRSEKLDFVRMYEPIQSEAEPIINFTGEIALQPVHIPQPEETITPAWEQHKPRSRTNIFDPHPEIPMSGRHNYRITDDDLGAGGQKTKYRNNVDAIRTLQAVESEDRFATPEEQEILSRYVGWGGIAQAFDADNPQWVNEYAELRAMLTPDEYGSAKASTLNAHYTSPTVIRAIYKAVENMGFTTGNVLEPSCGIGNFFGLLPESMSGSKMFGVELDSLTGRIARQFHQYFLTVTSTPANVSH